jgi:hypothetical protein
VRPVADVVALDGPGEIGVRDDPITQVRMRRVGACVDDRDPDAAAAQAGVPRERHAREGTLSLRSGWIGYGGRALIPIARSASMGAACRAAGTSMTITFARRWVCRTVAPNRARRSPGSPASDACAATASGSARGSADRPTGAGGSTMSRD